MGLDLDYVDGQTPLEDDEKEGLLIPTIATRGELDEFEQQNIEQAIQWTLTRNFKQQDIFSETFVREVHKRMYNQVWSWAGEFRKTNKNIGVDNWRVSTELKALLDDAIFWAEHDTYLPEELAIRFKHRLVSIHCFSNGNGRHSRLMADIIIDKIFKSPVFSWGAANISNEEDSRTAYLKALKTADNGDYRLLMTFARS
ncbi:MAG: mobile mystery protein B [Flammeovirgaceae bacterium]|nr:mobile mystery protein B [Flammeovirgaceae bacterium]